MVAGTRAAQVSEQPRFLDQVAIVTGATVGIGLSTCRELVRLGVRVVVVGRDAERVEQTVCELQSIRPESALGFRGDVRRLQDMFDAARAAQEGFGRIDILVASAGILRAKGAGLKSLHLMRTNEWDEVLDTNLTGVFNANRAVLPIMVARRRGQVINVSSTSGRKAYAFDTAYCASKFGVIGLTEAIAEEVRPFGVRVDVLLPGAIDTPMWEQNGPFRRPDYALAAERVADVIVSMLALPADTVLGGPVVEPLGKPGARGWRESPTFRMGSATSGAVVRGSGRRPAE